jgi:hypothetical protein
MKVMTMIKKQPFALCSIAQAAIISVAFGAASQASWAAMTEPYVSYTVKPKDTMEGLSRTLLKQPKQWPEVVKLNGIKNPNKLSLGQVINVPRSLLNMGSQPRVAVPGKVLSVQGDVKIGGQSVQVGAAVPEGARLETGPNSSAIVQLGDGSQVQMMPKTLAEVTTQHGYAFRDPSSSASTTWFSGAIRLVSGVMDTLANKQASRLSPLTVTTPTSVIGVRGTQFRVAFEDPASGISRTEVLEGKVQADNTAQKVNANLTGGFGAAINPKERDIKVVALLPALPNDQLPSEVVRTNIQSPTPDRAEWTVGNLAGAVSYRAQFATDEKFALIYSDIKSPTSLIDLSQIPNGKYYARVRGVDPSGIEGFDSSKQIEIKTAAYIPPPPPPPPVVLIWPGEISVGAVADYTPEGMQLKVNTSSVDAPSQLTVQVARDVNFSQNLQTTQLGKDAKVVLGNLVAGQRSYVRFTATNAQGQPTSSPVFTLDVPDNWGTTVTGMVQALQILR